MPVERAEQAIHSISSKCSGFWPIAVPEGLVWLIKFRNTILYQAITIAAK